MKNKDFLDFLISRKEPSAPFKELVRRDILLSFEKKSILSKFFGYQILGAFLSLLICPQFGIGLGQGHGIAHFFRMINDLACAAFCGSFFLSCGLILSYLGLKGEELWWIWQRYKYSLILSPAAFWSFLMITNLSLELSSEKISFHLVWVLMAILTQLLLMSLRSSIFLRKPLELK